MHPNQMAIQWDPTDNQTTYGVYVVYTPTPAKDPLCLYNVVCGNSLNALQPVDSTYDNPPFVPPTSEGYGASYR